MVLSCCSASNRERAALLPPVDPILERQQLQETIKNQWEELGENLEHLSADVDTQALKESVYRLQGINASLLAKKNSYQYRRTAARLSLLGVIVFSILTGVFLAISSLTSCSDSAAKWQWISFSCAMTSACTPMLALFFQSWHNKIEAEEARLDASLDQEVLKESILSRMAIILHNHQNSSEVSIGHNDSRSRLHAEENLHPSEADIRLAANCLRFVGRAPHFQEASKEVTAQIIALTQSASGIETGKSHHSNLQGNQDLADAP